MVVNSFVAILAGIAANSLIAAGTISMWLGYRARRGPRSDQVAALGERLEARLAELTRSVDAIALEVERIGEAQRYLMLERRSPSSLSEGRSTQGRSITPH